MYLVDVNYNHSWWLLWPAGPATLTMRSGGPYHEYGVEERDPRCHLELQPFGRRPGGLFLWPPEATRIEGSAS